MAQSSAAARPAVRPPRRSWLAIGLGVFASALVLLGSAALAWEIRTSTMQAWVFSRWAAELGFSVGPGPSADIRFPASGPFNDTRGYTRLDALGLRLAEQDYRVVLQARQSGALIRAMDSGLAPPYREPSTVGLAIYGAAGEPLYAARGVARAFDSFEQVPPLIVQTLLYIENRDLDPPDRPHDNPAIEWRRLAKAGLLQAGRGIGLSLPGEGGSTLATQMEKYRHSEGGRTASVGDKLRQIVSASLKAYREGPDTRERRGEIVVDYLNTVPLAAVAGRGEVHGLGDGLHGWFGLELADVVRTLSADSTDEERARAYQPVLALLCALRAPSRYLSSDRAALEARMNGYAHLLHAGGVIDDGLYRALRDTPLRFSPQATPPFSGSFTERKAVNALRYELQRLVGAPDLYALDRLHLSVDSSIDSALQHEVSSVLAQMASPGFVAAQGLQQPRLLDRGEPDSVVYSFMLVEARPDGNYVRVRTDTAERPLDMNEGMKFELGSTAKLRTLAHYLEVIATLHDELSVLDDRELMLYRQRALDPLSRWAAQTLWQNGGLPLPELLERALAREYSAGTAELFFTGGGRHTFRNFDAADNTRRMSVREASVRSTNLVFVRLMRDLVRFHEARLPYDPAAVLADTNNADRHRLLTEVADEEARARVQQAYRRYRDTAPSSMPAVVLRNRAMSARHLAIVYFAWHGAAEADRLGPWLEQHVGALDTLEVERLRRAYDNPRLTISDYGYLLGIHPLDLWAAGELARRPGLSAEELLEASAAARETASEWLFRTRNRRAQDLRLRARIERDAFARMTPAWQALGFPFRELVPSYATALGSSADRPSALAELMGVIVNDGWRRPVRQIEHLSFAAGTPYHTELAPVSDRGVQVLHREVAVALREVLAETVEQGTARRLRGAFVATDGAPLVVGGKTGSGDNRYKTVARSGQVVSSRSVSRTASFVFFIDERWYGVITASVEGDGAGDYRFTSSLPLAVLRLLAPVLGEYIANDIPPAAYASDRQR